MAENQSDNLVSDLRGISGILVDLPEGALSRLRKEKDNFSEVEDEIVANQAEWGVRGGVTEADVLAVTQATKNIEQIDTALFRAEKQVEILRESRAQQVHLRELKTSQINEKVELNAKHNNDQDLLAKYEKGRKYRSQSALKGVKTRQKNKETAEEKELADSIERRIAAILAVFAARSFAVSDEQRRTIEAATELAPLDRWLARSATAASVGDALA
jgi:hypothetical protein